MPIRLRVELRHVRLQEDCVWIRRTMVSQEEYVRDASSTPKERGTCEKHNLCQRLRLGPQKKKVCLPPSLPQSDRMLAEGVQRLKGQSGL